MYRKYILTLSTGLIIFSSVLGLYAATDVALVLQPGVIQCGDMMIFYPEQWTFIENTTGSTLEVGLQLEYGKPLTEDQTPDWRRFELRQFNCTNCFGGAYKATLEDYRREMDCKKKRRFEVPFACGSYIGSKNVEGTNYYYYVQNGGETFFKHGDVYGSLIVLFDKKGSFYMAQILFPTDKYNNAKKELEYIAKRLRVNSTKKKARKN